MTLASIPASIPRPSLRQSTAVSGSGRSGVGPDRVAARSSQSTGVSSSGCAGAVSDLVTARSLRARLRPLMAPTTFASRFGVGGVRSIGHDRPSARSDRIRLRPLMAPTTFAAHPRPSGRAS